MVWICTVCAWFNRGSQSLLVVCGSTLVECVSNVVRIWFEYGPNVIRRWFEYGSNVIRMWFEYGSNMVRMRLESGLNVVWMWSE